MAASVVRHAATACKQTVAVSLRLTGVSNCDRSQC